LKVRYIKCLNEHESYFEATLITLASNFPIILTGKFSIIPASGESSCELLLKVLLSRLNPFFLSRLKSGCVSSIIEIMDVGVWGLSDELDPVEEGVSTLTCYNPTTVLLPQYLK